MSFAGPGYLKAHSRSQTGERHFSCPVCDKSFRESSSRKKRKISLFTSSSSILRFPHVHAGQYAETGCCYYEVHPRSNLKKQIRRECLQLEGYYLLNFSRHPSLICLHCCLHQYKTLKVVATEALVVLTTSKSLKWFLEVTIGLLLV